MADLYEFPYIEWQQEDVVPLFENLLGIRLSYVKALPQQKHTFTHYRASLFPYLLEASNKVSSHLWKSANEIQNLAFSSGHRRILQSL